MSYKMGFFTRLKICGHILFKPQCKNMKSLSCEFCGSTNIMLNQSETLDSSGDMTETKEYKADYVCLNCMATCIGTQTWKRTKPEVVEKIRKQLEEESKRNV